MKKSFLLVLPILLPVYMAAQVSDSSYNQNTFQSNPVIPSNARFIRIIGTAHQFKSKSIIKPNIRLWQDKKNKIHWDSLDNENRVVYTVECESGVRQHLLTWVGDSVMYIPKDTLKGAKDSIIPMETYSYSVVMTKERNFKQYYPNGKTHSKGNYFSDLKHGKWVYYNENGKVIRREKWYYGLLKKEW